MASHRSSSNTPTVRLIGVVIAVLVATSATVVMASATAGAAPSSPSQTSQTIASDADRPAESDNSPGIIPKPNSGVKPVTSGDRGGSLQSILFVGMLAAMLFIAYLAYRDSRRSLARSRANS